MPPEDLPIPLIISLLLGFAPGYFFVKAQITAIEGKYRAELETWKMEAAGEIRKYSVNRSRSTLKGKIAEQMAPILPEFPFNPADARFIGSRVDYIFFDGLTEVADEKSRDIRIVFMVVKHDTGTLTRTQRVIRDAVENKAVLWQTMKIADSKLCVSFRQAEVLFYLDFSYNSQEQADGDHNKSHEFFYCLVCDSKWCMGCLHATLWG